MRLHTSVYRLRKRICTESWLWEGKKIPCRTGESNLRHRRDGPMLTRLHSRLYRHRKRIGSDSWLWEENLLPPRGIGPASAAWRSDALTNWATSHPQSIKAPVNLVIQPASVPSSCATESFDDTVIVLCTGRTLHRSRRDGSITLNGFLFYFNERCCFCGHFHSTHAMRSLI